MKSITQNEYLQHAGQQVTIAGKTFPLTEVQVEKTEPDSFELETTTVYSFPKRGNWATHPLNAAYRGNFAPQIARNMILRYSQPGDTVLDPFAGSGTTIIEAELLGRNGIGVDVNPHAALLCWNRVGFAEKPKTQLFVGDAANLDEIAENSVDLIVTHPPYANIIPYSNEPADVSKLGVRDFVLQMGVVAREFHRVLKPGKFCAILIGDTREKGIYKPISAGVLDQFLKAGFLLKEDIIKTQHNCTTTGFWKTQSLKHKFHLIMHEHLYVFTKPA